RRFAEDDELGRGQNGFQIDLQRPPTVAGHWIADDAILVVRFRTEADEAWAAICQSQGGLALDRGMDAAAADPANRLAFAKQQGAVAWLCRGGPEGTHHRGQHERLATASQLRRALEQVTGRGAAQSATPLSWRMRHRRG